jgi:hypothetical protein
MPQGGITGYSGHSRVEPFNLTNRVTFRGLQNNPTKRSLWHQQPRQTRRDGWSPAFVWAGNLVRLTAYQLQQGTKTPVGRRFK